MREENPIAYAPHGGIHSLKLGNGIVETTTYNARLEPTEIDAGSLFTLANCYDNSQSNCSGVTGLPATNNGNIWGQKVNGASRTYTYDGFNRLTSASQGGGQTYSYDTRGNRAVTGAGTNSLEVPTNYSAYTSDNRNSNWDYDGSGNVSRIPSTSLGPVLRSATYDAENRMVTETTATGGTATYFYEGDGRRVKKSVTPAGGVTADTVYAYDAMGNLVAEYGAPQSAGTRYLTADQLGSTRLITTISGTVDQSIDYFPFGEEIASAYPGYPQAAGASPIKFTSKERDAETGLDFFLARYMSGAQGRFTSPDRPFLDQDPSDPQSWNLYTYVRNNPLSHIDLSGTSCLTGDDGTFADDGDGKGCSEAGVKPGNPSDPQTLDQGQINATVTAQTGSLLSQIGDLFALLVSSPQDRFVPNDRPLDEKGQIVAHALSKLIDTYPTVCGGGAYVYAGREISVGGGHGFVGAIKEFDSRTGTSAGALFEAGGGEGVMGGGGYIATASNGQLSGSTLGYLGAGASTPVVSASGGAVAFGSGGKISGTGLYGEGFVFGRGGGAGAYVNITNVGKCR